MTCPWCSQPFPPKQGKVYCSTACRREVDSTLRDWVRAQLAAGTVTHAMSREYRKETA